MKKLPLLPFTKVQFLFVAPSDLPLGAERVEIPEAVVRMKHHLAQTLELLQLRLDQSLALRNEKEAATLRTLMSDYQGMVWTPERTILVKVPVK